MIAYIKGTLQFLLEETIVVDVGGVGYEIHCANPFIFESYINEKVFIHTYHHVREDLQTLYGFKTEDEKYLFTKLISVSGIGPKSANGILKGINVNEFVGAIEREDEKYLTQFPGVGKKTARQIILDLKGKLDSLLSIGSTEIDAQREIKDNVVSELIETLQVLGYTESEVHAVLPMLQNDLDKPIDELTKKALTLFVKN